MDRVQTIEQGFLKKTVPSFRVGDTVDVHVKIVEEAVEEEAKGAKKTAGKKKDGPQKRERIQIFSGLVIAQRHDGLRETFTVRRIVQGEGVERVFPLHSPNVVDVVVKRSGQVRRAKLYYLRNLSGKASRLKERVAKIAPEVVPPAPSEETPAAPQASAPAPEEKADKPKKAPAAAEPKAAVK